MNNHLVILKCHQKSEICLQTQRYLKTKVLFLYNYQDYQFEKVVNGKKNDPMMPVAWTRAYTTPSGKSARVFTSTMGAAQDFESEGLRKLLVQACYWCVGLENKIDGETKVDMVGDFVAPVFGFNAFRRGIKPAEHAW